MVSRLKTCDIALNPIVPGAAQSIINKVCDYAAAGLPVISTQDSDEYRQLLNDFQAGVSCEADAEEVSQAISRLIEDAELRKKMGKGSRSLAESKFNREVTYKELADLVLEHV